MESPDLLPCTPDVFDLAHLMADARHVDITDPRYHERVTEQVVWGATLTPEERTWWIDKLWPVYEAQLRKAADATR